jgi:prophage regulatory protein
MSKRLLRLPAVMAMTGLCRSHVYGKMNSGEFPKQVRLAPSTVGWLESEVEAWIEARVADRDATA